MHDRTARIELPPPAVRRLIEKLTPAIEEVETMRAKAAAARGAEESARREVDRAAEHDRQSAADFARGRLKTKPKAGVPSAREAAQRAADEAEVLALAAADAERELAEALNEHRAEYAPKLDHESEQAREKSWKAARRLAELEADRARVRALRRWVDGGSYSPGKSPPAAIEFRRPSGERYDLGELLPMIEAALAPPVEQPKPETRSLLRVTP
jgi:hypothetical protein